MERLNIHDLPECLLPDNRGLCIACCTYMNVRELNKPKETPCKHCTSQGCEYQSTNQKPMECIEFHCINVSNNMKWGLIAQCERDGTITSKEAKHARSLWIIS